MNTKNSGLLLAATMIVASLAISTPANADACDTSNSNCYTEDVTGPGSAELKTDVLRLGLGLGLCFVDSALPFACDPISGGLASAGAAFFNVTTFSNTPNHTVNVWAELDASSVCGPSTTCGFEMTVCTDRDDDGSCTNVAAGFDNLYNTHASSDPAACDSDDKDSKGDCTGRDASLTACLGRDDSVLGAGDWDDIVVFIGNWVGASTGALAPLGFPQNLGVGLAVGTWHVYLEDVSDADCVANNTQ